MVTVSGRTVCNVQKRLKRATQNRVLIQAAQEVQNKDYVSAKLRIAHSVALPLEFHVWATFTSKQFRCHVFQPLSSLYDYVQLAVGNGFISINSVVSFKVLGAKVGIKTLWLIKDQVLSSITSQPPAILTTNISVAPILALEDSEEGDNNTVNAERNSYPDFESERNTETIAVPPASRQANHIEELEKLELDHFTDSHCEKLRDMLREFATMWDGPLGTV